VRHSASPLSSADVLSVVAHELRTHPDSRCSAHLFMYVLLSSSLGLTGRAHSSPFLPSPGWVHTGERARTQEKPPGAWTPEQTVAYMLDKLAQGAFYIVCPDNDVSTVRSFLSVRLEAEADESGQDLDKLRIAWSVGDILEDRPALSRWHPECMSDLLCNELSVFSDVRSRADKARFDDYIRSGMGAKARSRSRGRVGGLSQFQ
jgi:hypothetical protein